MSVFNINSGYGKGLVGLPALDAGKVFHVAQVGTDIYEYLSQTLKPDADGTVRLYGAPAASGTSTTSADVVIQAALDATVANRNDYVIVHPANSDYDLIAALTLSKNRVHLICPAGIGWNGIPGNCARVHMNTATTNHFTVTGDNVEIAGFFFKGYDGTAHDEQAIIYLSGTRWCPHIHDNFFGIGSTAASANYGIYGDGAVSHYSIHHNYFTNYAPGAMTGTDNGMAAFIGLTSGSSTRGVISNNIMHTGANTTVDVGLNVATAYGIIADNIMVQDGAVGAAQAGVITAGINTSSTGIALRNLILGGVLGSAAFTGGTADFSCGLNYVALNGGTLVDEDTA